MNYMEAKSILQNRQSKKLGNNTYLVRLADDALAVRLHQTDVVRFNADGSITLNSGGWKTVTTKDRLNKYGPLGIYQEKYVWKFGYNGKTYDYRDGVTLTADGAIVNID